MQGVDQSRESRASARRRLGERLGLVYSPDHPLRVDRTARSRALALRVFAFLAAAAVMFWVLYGITRQPAAFGFAALLTFFAVMRLRGLTKRRD